MLHKINIRGVLIPNDYKWFYDWFEEDSTCPADVQKILDAVQEGDAVEVYISSPGGVIEVGTEIYTMLHMNKDRVKIYITGEACSAASIVAMAAHCEMAPTALMMVHCTSVGASGNHNILEKAADMLKTADKALCQAYMLKANMTEEEALQMMEAETWLTAEQAKERGLIDGIMFENEQEEYTPIVAGPLFALPSEERMELARRMMKEADKTNTTAFSDISQQRLNFLRLKGETR